ncbi:MAG: DPP IV N-terminal domain-containing protein, partial [Mucinivorans sp.]
MKKFLLLAFAITLCATGTTNAQRKPITESNYELPARFTPDKMRSMVFSTTIDPHFLKHGQQFWYVWDSPSGKNWWIVDPVKATKTKLFETSQLAAQLTSVVGDPFDALHLPIFNIRFNDNQTAFTFQIASTADMTKAEAQEFKERQTRTEIEPETKVDQKKKIFTFSYDLASRRATELKDYEQPKGDPSWANVSPDRRIAVFARDYNLYWITMADMEKAKKNEKDSTIVEHRFTTDGEQYFPWGGSAYSTKSDKVVKERGVRRSVDMLWSPSGTQFAILRVDQRKVGDLWVINNTSTPRPVLETYKYDMPGDSLMSQYHLSIFDTVSFTPREVNLSAYKDQIVGLMAKPRLKSTRDDLLRPAPQWLGSASTLYLTRQSRDMKRIDICALDLSTMTLRAVIKEKMNVSMETRQLWLAAGGKELIHWSERSGWAGLYLYNADGTLKNTIVEGEFHVDDILGVDEASRTVYFTAMGVNKGENPYYAHTFSVKLDGSAMRQLDATNFEHSVSLSDENRYFVDNFSRVDTTPAANLYDNTGRKVMELEKADLSLLFAAGYKFPEIFTFKAADGQTDLY